MIGIAQQKYIFVPIYFPIISSPCNFCNLNIQRTFNSADPLLPSSLCIKWKYFSHLNLIISDTFSHPFPYTFSQHRSRHMYAVRTYFYLSPWIFFSVNFLCTLDKFLSVRCPTLTFSRIFSVRYHATGVVSLSAGELETLS